MAQINPKITIRSVYFGMLLLSAAVMILTVRLTVASDLNSIYAAAEPGDAEAQVFLGYMYAAGEGVPENDTEAVRLFRMAAEQGECRCAVQSGVYVCHRRSRSPKRYRGGAMVSHGRGAGGYQGAAHSGLLL